MLAPLTALNKTVVALSAGGVVAAVGGACKAWRLSGEGICTQILRQQGRCLGGCHALQTSQGERLPATAPQVGSCISVLLSLAAACLPSGSPPVSTELAGCGACAHG